MEEEDWMPMVLLSPETWSVVTTWTRINCSDPQKPRLWNRPNVRMLTYEQIRQTDSPESDPESWNTAQ